MSFKLAYRIGILNPVQTLRAFLYWRKLLDEDTSMVSSESTFLSSAGTQSIVLLSLAKALWLKLPTTPINELKFWSLRKFFENRCFKIQKNNQAIIDGHAYVRVSSSQ